MSINHISSDLPETLWWTKQQHIMMDSTKKSSSPSPLWPHNTPQFYHHHHSPTPPSETTTTTMFGFNLNNTNNEEDEEQTTEEKEENLEREEEEEEIPKEHLFEKPLTPSDVGKLNRLVIPKQHAEKYFPLSGTINNNNNNNESGEKGLLLSFEDESGKTWRFRYSYWNSSQSYVLTKGWSRFVKEKRLDAGDIVLFERHRLDGERLFIGWRRRNATVSASATGTAVHENTAVPKPGMVGGGGGGGVSGWAHQVYYGGHPYPGAGLPYQPDCPHAGRGTITANVNNTRRQVRLFGVNLECDADDQSSSWSTEQPPTTSPSGGGSSTSSHRHHHQGQGQASQHYYQYQFQYSKPHVAVPAAAAGTAYNNNNHHNHMDMNVSRDVNQQMRYHQG